MCCTAEPVLIERQCGGWMAISPRLALIKIGVTAPDERTAKDLYEITYAKWLETLSRESMSTMDKRQPPPCA